MTSRANDLLLIDLDGTLVSGNSFHMWLRYILRDGLVTVRFASRWFLRCQVVLWIGLRLMRMIDHGTLKRRIQRVWQGAIRRSTAPDRELERFVDTVLATVNQPLLQEIGAATAHSAKTILTTAAAGEYAELIGQKLGFDAVVTTPALGSGAWCHNIGPVKYHRTKSLIVAREWQDRRQILYSDHLDDLKLMQHADVTYLVTQSRDLRDTVKLLLPEGADIRIFPQNTRDDSPN